MRIPILLLTFLLFWLVAFGQIPEGLQSEVDQVLALIDEISELERQLESAIVENELYRDTNRNLDRLYGRLQKAYDRLQKENHERRIQFEKSKVTIDSMLRNEKKGSETMNRYRDSLAQEINCLNDKLLEVETKASAQTKQWQDRVQEIYRDLEERRFLLLKRSNHFFINRIDPILYPEEINRPKKISFDLFYYPLYQEEIPSSILVEISLRNSQENSFITYRVRLMREFGISNDFVPGQRNGMVFYVNDPLVTYELEGLRKNVPYRAYIRIGEIMIVSDPFRLR